MAGFRVAFGSGNRVPEPEIAGFRIALDYIKGEAKRQKKELLFGSEKCSHLGSSLGH